MKEKPKSTVTPNPPAHRDLCLLVPASMALTNAWMNTLKNNSMAECREADEQKRRQESQGREDGDWGKTLGDDIILDDEQTDADECWQSGEGLTVERYSPGSQCT